MMSMSPNPVDKGADTRIKVLFVVGSLSGGGAERFVSHCLGVLDRARFDPSLVLFRDEIDYPLPDDVTVHTLHKTRPWHIPRTIWRMKRLIAKVRPDVILSAYSFQNVTTGLALWLLRSRPVWIARIANAPEREERGLYRVLTRMIYRMPDHIVVIGIGVASGFAKLYPSSARKISVIRNATDFDYIDKLAAEDRPVEADSRPTIIAVGRLYPQKRYDILMDAFAIARRDHDARLIILGDGPLKGKVENQIRNLGLTNHVDLIGYVSNPYAYMARADIFAMSSDFEGFSNALIEAQALGIASVATDCPYGNNEIIEDGCTGILVPTGDALALAAAIGRLLADPGKRREYGKAARERARREFSKERLGREIAQLLEDAFCSS